MRQWPSAFRYSCVQPTTAWVTLAKESNAIAEHASKMFWFLHSVSSLRYTTYFKAPIGSITVEILSQSKCLMQVISILTCIYIIPTTFMW